MLNLEQLTELREQYATALNAKVASFDLRGKTFDPYPNSSLMGVVNLSSDSWYRESVCLTAESAIRRARRLSTEGATLIDIGAESTILNAKTIDAQTQTSLLLPIVKELSAEKILVSVETYHPEVTRAVLDAGAAVLNMTSASKTDEIYRMVADHDAGVIICYVQGGDNVRSVGDFSIATDHASILKDYFSLQIDLATKHGVKRIWIDPGLGFYYRNLQDSSTRVRYQMKTFLSTFRLRELGWPTCHALPHAFEYFEEEVRSAEPFFAIFALLGKTDLLRTHEVAKVRAVLSALSIYE